MANPSIQFAELIRKLLAAFRAAIDTKPDNQAELDRLKAEFAVERAELQRQLVEAQENDVDITNLSTEIDEALDYAGQSQAPVTPPVE